MNDAPAPPPPPQSARPLRVLIVEDSPEDTQLLLFDLEQSGYQVDSRRVDSAETLRHALSGPPWDIVLSDHNMPDFSSTEALALVRERDPDLPFIIVSGSIGEEQAVAAMRAGARDYILKGNARRLIPAIERELREAADRRERRKAELSLFAQQEQLRIAREIQQRLFPVGPPLLKGWTLAGSSRPADSTGGDYYDYIPMTDGSLLVVVGDVSGHGLGPALLMAETRECIRALALTSADLGEMLQRAALLLRPDFGYDSFMTLLLCQVHPGAGRLTWVNAGHPSGYVLGGDGRVKHELKSAAAAIGLSMEFAPPRPASLVLEPGDLALLFTDGLVEAFGETGEEFGEQRILDVARARLRDPARHLVEALFASVTDFITTSAQQDDITAVVLRREKEDGP